MTNKLALLFFLMTLTSFAQQKEIDSVDIEFKAKLLTVSRYGVSAKELISNDVENQKIIYLKSEYKNFIFLKIKFEQPYRLDDDSEKISFGHCNYYLSYNKKNKIFYRLGGFDYLDIDEFFQDLKKIEVTDFIGYSEVIGEIDINCLYKFYKMNSRKRGKNKSLCFLNCNEQIIILGGKNW